MTRHRDPQTSSSGCAPGWGTTENDFVGTWNGAGSRLVISPAASSLDLSFSADPYVGDGSLQGVHTGAGVQVRFRFRAAKDQDGRKALDFAYDTATGTVSQALVADVQGGWSDPLAPAELDGTWRAADQGQITVSAADGTTARVVVQGLAPLRDGSYEARFVARDELALVFSLASDCDGDRRVIDCTIPRASSPDGSEMPSTSDRYTEDD